MECRGARAHTPNAKDIVMATSEARIAANRINALKSTGPRTCEGKEHSRANAFKHGLTGEGIVLASEDVARIERRFAGLEAEFRSGSEADRSLVRRAALLMVRLERCEVQEAAALSVAIRSAEADFDDARDAEVEHLMATIADNPATSLRRLMRMPEGVEALIGTWNRLRQDLRHGDGSRWGAEHSAMAQHLEGRKPGGFGFSRVEALSGALGGDFSLLDDEDGAGLDPKARREWARQALSQAIAEVVAGLEEHRETLDYGAIAEDRAGAASRAMFDPSKVATLARKYEAAAARELHRTLGELKGPGAARRTAPSGPRAPTPSASLGSFSTGVFPRDFAPPPAPAPVPPAPRSGASGGSSYVPFAIGRAPTGSA
jgi:hypothetical protein